MPARTPAPAKPRPTKTTTKTPPTTAKPPAKRATTRKSAGKAAGLLAAASGPPAAAGMLPLDAIDPDHWPNPRGQVDETSDAFAELVDSIREQGVLQPVAVGPALVDGGRHPLAAGWRRYHAARAAGLAAIPVHQLASVQTAVDALVAGVAENVAREDMSQLAEARAIDALMREHKLTQVAVGKRVGMSERTVRERLRLLNVERNASADVAQAMSDGHVPARAMTWVAELAKVAPQAAERLVELVETDQIDSSLLTRRDGALRNTLRGLPGLLEDNKAEVWGGWQGVKGMPWTDEARGAEIAKQHAKAKRGAAGIFDGGVRLTATERDALTAAGRYFQAPDGGAFIVASPELDDVLDAAVGRVQRRRVKHDREQAKRDTARHDDAATAAAAAARKQRAAEVREYAREGNRELAAAIAAMRMPDGELVDRFILERAIRGGHSLRELVELRAEILDDELDVEATVASETPLLELLRGFAAASYLDLRAFDHRPFGVKPVRDDEPSGLASLVDDQMPDRARRMRAARLALERATDALGEHAQVRRVLYELADDGGEMKLGDLLEAARSYGWRSDRVCVEQIRGVDAVQDAASFALVAVSGEPGEWGDVDRLVTLTDAGRAELDGPPPPKPELEDIDPPGPLRPDESDAPAARVTVPAGLGKWGKQAFEAIAARPGITIPEIAAAIGTQQSALYRLLPDLQKQGHVSKAGRGWHITPTTEARS